MIPDHFERRASGLLAPRRGLYYHPEILHINQALTVAPAGGGWTPASVGGLALWLDASDTATLTVSGSPSKVSQWDDKSGNGRNFTQGTGANQPVSGATTRNSLNVVDFVAANGTCVKRSSTDLDFTSGGFSFFGVMTTSADGVWFNTTTQPFPNGKGWYMYNGQVNLMQAVNTAAVAGSTGVTGWHYYSMVDDAATPRTKVWKDASLDATDTATVGHVASTGPQQVGTYIEDTSTAAFTGSIGELFIYSSALGATDRQAAEAYLAAKWGIP